MPVEHRLFFGRGGRNPADLMRRGIVYTSVRSHKRGPRRPSGAVCLRHSTYITLPCMPIRLRGPCPQTAPGCLTVRTASPAQPQQRRADAWHPHGLPQGKARPSSAPGASRGADQTCSLQPAGARVIGGELDASSLCVENPQHLQAPAPAFQSASCWGCVRPAQSLAIPCAHVRTGRHWMAACTHACMHGRRDTQ
eukprot:365063-Chlamydomonas_euryale.AAC.3